MAWSVLQSNGGTAASSTTCAVAFTGNLSSGSKILCFTANNNGITTVKDTANNSLSAVFTSSGATWGTGGVMTVYAMDTPGGDVGATTTITATGPSSDFWGMVVQEVSGLAAGATAAILDGTPGQQVTPGGFGAGSVTTSTPAYSSTAASEYLVGFYGDNGGNDSSVTAATGYTVDAHSSLNANCDCIVAYKNSTNGSESVAFTLTAANGLTETVVLMAFKLPSVTSGPPLVSRMMSRPVVVPGFAGQAGAAHSR